MYQVEIWANWLSYEAKMSKKKKNDGDGANQLFWELALIEKLFSIYQNDHTRGGEES